MTSRNRQEQPIDPQLEEMLELLRPTPPIDDEMAARGQAKFMAEMEELFGPLPSSPLARLTGWISNLYQPKEKYTMATSKQKFVFATIAVFIAMFVLIFGGVSATAYAAQFSLPGDALYPVKTSLEQTQVELSMNAARQAELQLEFAQRRLDEMAALIEEGRFNDIETATGEFEYHIQQAISTLEFVAAGDPARAEELAAQIASALSSYAGTLSGMMANVPETVKPAFERAMMASQPAGSVAADDEEEIEFTGVVESVGADSWTVAGRGLSISSQTELKGSIAVGDTVKVHAYEVDGKLFAREIEPVIEEEVAEESNENSGDDDVLSNENGNMNGDDNENSVFDNMNGNDNDVENMNISHDNDNDHDSGNVNGDDDNSNDNENANHNDNSNDNANDNHNDNGNDNTHDNSNDNTHDNGNSNNNDNGSDDNGNDNSGSDD